MSSVTIVLGLVVARVATSRDGVSSLVFVERKVGGSKLSVLET